MKVDVSQSVYHEDPDAEEDFDTQELKRCRLLLRRLRFLEAQVRNNGGMENGSGGAVFAELEAEALEWILKEVEYLPEQNSKPSTPRSNRREGAGR